MYSSIVQKIVVVLEENLLTTWQLEQYAEKIGYSKFYLTSQFRKETGVTIGEYIRKRRLAVSAFLLLHTDSTILDISFECQFQSQEAFTRAFKKVYSITPGKYRNMMRSLHLKEEKEMSTSNEIKGWILTGSNPSIYKMKTDHEIFHTGTRSGHLSFNGTDGEGQFGTMMQTFSAQKWLGKRMKISCFIKTKNVIKCGAWCRVDSKNGDLLQFDNMDNRSIHGTNDWNYYSIVLDILEESCSIHFGLLLTGTGEAWIDGISFEEVDNSVSSTNMTSSADELPLEPVNLGFDDL